ncbi:MAG: heavy metal transporter [Deltaproteobacteria bacterium HGW-Deltaproteobacteria-14]|jgi:copper chaperone|nr:MAG: heavy metal transporter [Deltaproteobacteria bacterium HGW-Deltaproteobacteria-14]
MSNEGPHTASYLVDGMTCNGCVRSVTAALNRALPDLGVNVSLADGTVTVSGRHTPEQVAAAVEDAGFDYTGPAAG